MKLIYLLFFILYSIPVQGKWQSFLNAPNKDSLQIVKAAKYKGIIFSANYKIGYYFGDDIKRYTPTYSDIEQFEKFMLLYHKYPKRYKRQYVGLINKSNQKILLVRFLNLSKPRMRRETGDWKKSYVIVLGDYFYKNSGEVMFNLNENKIIESID